MLNNTLRIYTKYQDVYVRNYKSSDLVSSCSVLRNPGLYLILLWLPVLFLASSPVYGQSKISIHSENNQIIDATTIPSTQYLNGDVKVFHSGTFMYCDTAVLKGSDLKMYTNVVLFQNDTIRIFADSLHYNGDSLVAYFYGDIIFENGKDKKLYTTFLKYDVKNKIGYYTKNARMVDKTTTLISKRGRYQVNDKKAWFYDNVKITGDDFDLSADSLTYKTTTQISEFLSPVRINKDTSMIFSEGGWFDLNDKVGDFIGNAQYKSGRTIAKADTISYDGKSDIVTLKSNKNRSEYYTEKDTALAKNIFYDKKNQIFKLTTDAWYKSEKNEVSGDKVFYNKSIEKFKISGRSKVSDPPSIIEADTLDYDKTIKFGKADGHVIWQDTAAKTSINADHVIYIGQENFLKATNDTGRPLFSTQIDNDTLFMKADTLKSFRVIKERIVIPSKDAARKARLAKTVDKQADSSGNVVPDIPAIKTDPNISTDAQSTDKPTEFETKDKHAENNQDTPSQTGQLSSLTDTIFTGIMDTIDYFIGDNNVRIFKSDMQAICDSLVYNKKDSLFTLHNLPFVWSDSTQINGDTIDIKLKSKKVDRLFVRSEATILSSDDFIFFNQIKGRFLEAFFDDSKIYRIDVDGNARIVYYMTDNEKAYTGVNTTEASTMSFFLKDNKITDIRNYKEPKSVVLPMRKTNHEELKVKGFLWNIVKRPSGLTDL